MRIVIHLLDGSTDLHEGDFDLVNRDGILSVIRNQYQGPVLTRTEYPLTSIRNWVYTR